MAEPRNAFGEFVGGLVPLGDAHQRQGGSTKSSFASVVGRLTESGNHWGPSSFTGAGFLAGGALFAAVLPSPGAATDSFWRVGRNAVSDILGVGDVLALPLVLASLVLLVLCTGALLHGSHRAMQWLAIQPFVGGIGLLGVVALWAGFLALALANLAVLILIIIAYVVATIVITGLLIGFFIGLLSQ